MRIIWFEVLAATCQAIMKAWLFIGLPLDFYILRLWERLHGRRVSEWDIAEYYFVGGFLPLLAYWVVINKIRG